MIGQLHKNIRVIGTTVVLFSAALATPMTAMAENVTVELIATDWVILVKSENSVLTELSRYTHGPTIFTEVETTINLDVSADKFEENYLYILAGNRHDGLLPYLAGHLKGHKTLITNDPKILVLESKFYDHEKIPNGIGQLEEVISGGFSDAPFAPTAAVRGKDASKLVNGDSIPSAWSHLQRESGPANIFRIPYSALFNPPTKDTNVGPTQNDSSNTSDSNGVTVNVDVGGLLGSLFGNEDKKEKDVTPIDETTSTVSHNNSTSTEISQITGVDDPPVEADPVIITEYISDPNVLADRDRLLEERTGMLTYIEGLTNVIKEREATIRELRGDLTRAQNGVDSLPALITPLRDQINTQKDALKARREELTIKTNEISNLNKKIGDLEALPKPLSKPVLIGGGLGLLGLGGLAGLRLGRRRHNKTCERHLPPIKREEKKREKSQGFESLKKGMAFAASPMMLGGLPPALAAIKPVYDAVGRIGFAQDGKPVGKDESFGTGILVSENHILTNRHVWEMFKHRLTSDEPTGIEFYGEKESDKSDFVTFADVEPVYVEGWDAAIFTLSRTPENRKAVTITPRPAEQLNDLDIVVVGYPQAQRLTEDIDEVTEKDPIFGVKRYSEGKIFRHSADIENPYGVEAAVESIINPSEAMRAICHNASTLGGSSGSAVVCKKSGELIALHFGFDSAYEWEEAANFAVAGENLADKVAKIINTVTPITEIPAT